MNSIEREIPPLEEKPNINITVNGIDNSPSERSRSPSPTLDLPIYSNIPDPILHPRISLINNSSEFTSSIQNDPYTFPGFVSDDKQISQILKEANSINSTNITNSNNLILDIKPPKVSKQCIRSIFFYSKEIFYFKGTPIRIKRRSRHAKFRNP